MEPWVKLAADEWFSREEAPVSFFFFFFPEALDALAEEAEVLGTLELKCGGGGEAGGSGGGVQLPRELQALS